MLPQIGNKISLAEHAYLVIRAAILNNELKPLERLSEEDLAGKLGISRTPLRTALKKLEFEKLVFVGPGKNMVVADVDEKDIRNAFVIRCSLEQLAARIACETIDKQGIAELDKNLKQQRKFIKENNLIEYLNCDQKFHEMIVHLADNERLEEIIQNLTEHNHRYRKVKEKSYFFNPAVLEEHEAILEGIKKRDADMAGEKMLYHLQQNQKRLFHEE